MKQSPDGHGTMNWMVTWQSLHGGICIEYYETEREAVQKVVHLEGLGRIPRLWRQWGDIHP